MNSLRKILLACVLAGTTQALALPDARTLTGSPGTSNAEAPGFGPPASCTYVALSSNGTSTVRVLAPLARATYARNVYLITATELTAAGFPFPTAITSMGWNYAQAPDQAGTAPLALYLQNTSDTTNTKSTTWATAIAGMTQVHNATTTLPTAAGPFDIAFSGGSAFTYTGGALYVAVDWGPYFGNNATTGTTRTTSTVTNSILWAQNDATQPTTLTLDDFRPETRLNSLVQNDAAVRGVFSFGEAPLGTAGPQIIRAAITNFGAAALTDRQVTLNVSGATSFTDTQPISLGACGDERIIDFVGFPPAGLGTHTVEVSVPSDEVQGNNAKSTTLDITERDYSYKIPGTTTTTGFGTFGQAFSFAAKFSLAQANAISEVKLEFTQASSTTYKIGIYGDSGSGSPSNTPLYLDAVDRTVTAAGPVTITLPAPVPVGPGNVFVGIEQTNNESARYSCDLEVPLRTNTFYMKNPSSLPNWGILISSQRFKFNVGFTLQNLASAETPTPTPTETQTPTETPTEAPEDPATSTPTHTPDPEATATETPDSESTPTHTPDPDATATPTRTATSNRTATPTRTPGATQVPAQPGPSSSLVLMGVLLGLGALLTRRNQPAHRI